MAAAAVIVFIFLLTRRHSTTQIPSIDLTTSTPEVEQATPQDKSQAHKPSRPASTDSSSGLISQVDTPKAQRPIKDTSGLPLVEKLAYQFPYDVVSRFPAYIWQTWKTSPSSAEFDEAFREAEASWTELHPGFVHEVITDKVAVYLITHLYSTVPEVLEAYKVLPHPVLKADFFRYLILLARGGIYTDIDTHALKSALDWVPSNVPQDSIGMVIGIEADPDRPDWEEWYSRRIQFCQWTIQAKPGHPILREVVAHITAETLRRKAAGKLTLGKNLEGVVEFTGPAAWTDIIFNYFNDARYFDLSNSKSNISWKEFTGMTAPKKLGDVVVLPITSFSPGVQQMGAGDWDDPMAYVGHDFQGMLSLPFNIFAPRHAMLTQRS